MSAGPLHRVRAAPALAAALLAVLAAVGVRMAPGDAVERGQTARPAPAGAAQGAAARSAPAKASASTPAQAPVAAAASAASSVTAAVPPEPPPPSACDVLLHRLPTVSRAQCESAALAPSGAQSVKGVPLYWRDVPAAAAAGHGAARAQGPQGTERPLRVLVAGAIHGDEITSASLAVRWIALAEQARRPVHWRFIPVLNPDGLLARPATRTNARGVDLNRNFPTPGWAQDAPHYWEKRTRRDPRRWPGTAPLSEPESGFLHAQMAAFQPQLIVSIHAPYGVLDFDGPQSPPERLGRLWLDQVGIFPGSLGHYAGVHRGIPVVTIELPHALDMPRAAEIQSMWEDLLRWMGEHWPQVDAAARP
ncbi:M14 family zinc carboxypeptidase [Paracidovorax sp. MALMAid1276]|uniref:M14 family zinc carboxypeptidase n=1 Tax=Paracidovorax sp. MALMAid1276 TaxID=3411631 RepID=UPI003B9D2EAD